VPPVAKEQQQSDSSLFSDGNEPLIPVKPAAALHFAALADQDAEGCALNAAAASPVLLAPLLDALAASALPDVAAALAAPSLLAGPGYAASVEALLLAWAGHAATDGMPLYATTRLFCVSPHRGIKAETRPLLLSHVEQQLDSLHALRPAEFAISLLPPAPVSPCAYPAPPAAKPSLLASPERAAVIIPAPLFSARYSHLLPLLGRETIPGWLLGDNVALSATHLAILASLAHQRGSDAIKTMQAHLRGMATRRQHKEFLAGVLLAQRCARRLLARARLEIERKQAAAVLQLPEAARLHDRFLIRSVLGTWGDAVALEVDYRRLLQQLVLRRWLREASKQRMARVFCLIHTEDAVREALDRLRMFAHASRSMREAGRACSLNRPLVAGTFDHWLLASRISHARAAASNMAQWDTFSASLRDTRHLLVARGGQVGGALPQYAVDFAAAAARAAKARTQAMASAAVREQSLLEAEEARIVRPARKIITTSAEDFTHADADLFRRARLRTAALRRAHGMLDVEVASLPPRPTAERVEGLVARWKAPGPAAVAARRRRVRAMPAQSTDCSFHPTQAETSVGSNLAFDPDFVSLDGHLPAGLLAGGGCAQRATLARQANASLVHFARVVGADPVTNSSTSAALCRAEPSLSVCPPTVSVPDPVTVPFAWALGLAESGPQSFTPSPEFVASAVSQGLLSAADVWAKGRALRLTLRKVEL
jgi:hypothetical protein